ncbi:MAG: LolA-related protein [Steroidobacteraceae bacterium]
MSARLAALLQIALALGGIAATAAAANTDTDTLGRLMQLLSQRQHGVAEFEQTEYLAALRQPAHSSGVMTYAAPDHLEEHTLKPREQSVTLDHGTLTLQSGTRRRTLRLDDYPQIAPLIDSVRATLAGDRAALEQRFELRFSGDVARWQLLLHPRDPKVAAVVDHIRISGERDAILQVEVQQSDGDHSLMTIQPRE